jgi:hypothetical protein
MQKETWFQIFKASIPVEEQPWVLAALRQDITVWQALHTRPLQQKLSEQAAHDLQQPAAWSPAALARLALTPADDSSLLQQAFQAYQAQRTQSPKSRRSAAPLSHAGLVALALQEQYRKTGSWQELIEALQATSPATWQTPLACLYGLLPAPLELLHALLKFKGYLALALHLLLSNPLPPAELVEALGRYGKR